jgi:NAD(P)-dependent dehydrogenase (short-subunit alcohol dehydrogenase family)
MLLRQDPDEAEAILKSAVTQSQQAFTARIPLRRTGFPDDFARVALFLASAASDFMTGNLIVVDGGFLQS